MRRAARAAIKEEDEIYGECRGILVVAQGHVDQDEFVPLRDAIELRNAIVHGHLDQLPERDAIQRLVTDARRLLRAA